MASIFKRKADRNRRDKPYLIAYTDENGRRKVITGSSDKTVSMQIASTKEAEICKRRHGITTAAEDRFTREAKRPIADQVQEYMEHCHHLGMSPRTLGQKRRHLEDWICFVEANRLKDVTDGAFSKYLHRKKDEGKSARTVNHHRSDVMAFLNWCVKTGRIPQNPLKVVPKLDEDADRRRVRRPLCDEELARLLDVAAEQDKKNGTRHPPRRIIYLLAAMTGLRRNELKQLRWHDYDEEAEALRIRIGVGKAKREDLVALHSQVSEALRELKSQGAQPTDNIFKSVPTIITFYKDLARAREAWIAEGATKAEQESKRQSTFLAKFDEEGRVVDFHAMRTTLGTRLALQGVAPQLAQRIMRHSDYRTTLQHYTVLGLADTAKAINQLPEIGGTGQAELRATGTDGRAAPGAARRAQNTALCGATPRPSGQPKASGSSATLPKQPPLDASLSAELHQLATALGEHRVMGLEPSTFSHVGCKPSESSIWGQMVYAFVPSARTRGYRWCPCSIQLRGVLRKQLGQPRGNADF